MAREVVGTIVTEDDKTFVDLTIKAGDSKAAALISTTTHPFWVESEGAWIDAGDLRPGMELRTPAGDTATVTAIRPYEKRQRTHDLTVKDIHTYYVVAEQTPVLVHNCPKKKPAQQKPDEVKTELLEAGVEAVLNGRPQRLKPDGVTLDTYKRRASTSDRTWQKWGRAEIYDIPGGGNDYRVLINSHGDIGWIRGHNYDKVMLFKAKGRPPKP